MVLQLEQANYRAREEPKEGWIIDMVEVDLRGVDLYVSWVS
jgi:hypothetical protein